MLRFLALCAFAFSVLTAPPSSAQTQWAPAGTHAPATPDQKYPPRAPEAIFRANCATCHGALGMGGVSWVDPTRFASQVAGDPTAYIAWRVRNGILPVMPAFPMHEISDEELDLLVDYVTNLPGSYVPEPAYQTTVTILDEDPWFSPLQVTIQPGDTVRFVNGGRTYHPAVELSWLTSHGRRGANSGQLGPGGVYYQQFGQAGKYTFLCGMHPYMRGEIHVGQGFTPPTYSLHTPMPPPAIPGLGEVWVCAQFQDWPARGTDGVIQVIDTGTWTVTSTIPVGNNPHNLWFGAGGNQALVTNWFGTTLSRIDANTKTLIGSDCVGGASPAHVTSDFNGTYWYVSIEGSHHVRRFTQASGPEAPCGTTMMPPAAVVSGYGPHGIWYANGKLVTSNSMDSTFSIIDEATLTETACLPAGMHPLGASANAAGTLGASGSLLDKSVSLYDLVAQAKVRDIPVAGGAIQVPFTPNGRYIFAANGTQVSVIDVARALDVTGYPDPASAIVANIPTGSGAHGVAFGPKAGGGNYAYVSHKFENYVSVIDVTTRTRVGDVPLVTTTTGKVSLAGATDTGGNGIAVRPNPAPWQ
ncbi:MAG: c-type cytochrome [Planctomycetes bacterium]|nr:c-type cytochrome [Planctomycetota bacterium]